MSPVTRSVGPRYYLNVFQKRISTDPVRNQTTIGYLLTFSGIKPRSLGSPAPSPVTVVIYHSESTPSYCVFLKDNFATNQLVGSPGLHANSFTHMVFSLSAVQAFILVIYLGPNFH